MKKLLLALALLLSGSSLMNAVSWSEMIQGALTGGQQPVAASSSASAPSAAQASGWDFLKGLAGDQSAVTTAATANQSLVAQIRDLVPSVIANIKLVAPALANIATKSQEGFFSGISAVFSTDSATKQALGTLIQQIKTIVSAAQNLFNTADPATKETVKGLLNQVTRVPEFNTLFQQAKDAPFIGSALKSLTEFSDQPVH